MLLEFVDSLSVVNNLNVMYVIAIICIVWRVMTLLDISSGLPCGEREVFRAHYLYLY